MSRRTGLHVTCKSRASGADSMIKTILLVMSFVFLPSVAFAQTATDPGDGTDLHRVNREVEAMTRDGRWQRLLDEANGVRHAVTPFRSGNLPHTPRSDLELWPNSAEPARMSPGNSSRGRDGWIRTSTSEWLNVDSFMSAAA